MAQEPAPKAEVPAVTAGPGGNPPPGGGPAPAAPRDAVHILKEAGAELLPQASDLVKAMDPWGVRELMSRPGRLMWINFLAGIVRGIGFTIGVTVLGGLVLSWALSFLKPVLQVPVVGGYVAEIVASVQRQVDADRPPKGRKP